MPSLIEVYVNSIVIKSTKSDHLNEPMTNEEVLAIYRNSVFSENGTVSKDNRNIAPQLLMLYFVLLYSDTVLNNMKIIGK